jgi:hypothetical protein
VIFQHPVRQADLDPAAFVKQALTSRHARVDAPWAVRGRDAIRIRVSHVLYGKLEPIGDYFVEQGTYRPIRVVVDATRPSAGEPLAGMPLISLTLVQGATLPQSGGRFVFDFTKYGHLAPTTANRRLTDIRAAHPGAKVV